MGYFSPYGFGFFGPFFRRPFFRRPFRRRPFRRRRFFYDPYYYGYYDDYGYYGSSAESDRGCRREDPARVRAAVAPVARHGQQELCEGRQSTRHVMDEVAAGGYLVGRGYDGREAVETVENWERKYGWPVY